MGWDVCLIRRLILLCEGSVELGASLNLGGIMRYVRVVCMELGLGGCGSEMRAYSFGYGMVISIYCM